MINERTEQLARIAEYEPIQRQVCTAAGAEFDPPSYDKFAWIGPGVVGANGPFVASRYPETATSSGWVIASRSRPSPEPHEYRIEHLRHLVSLREALVPFLALPQGWAVQLNADGSWSASSLSDRIAHLANRVDNDRAADAVVELADLLELHPEFPRPSSLDTNLLRATPPDFGIIVPLVRTITSHADGDGT